MNQSKSWAPWLIGFVGLFLVIAPAVSLLSRRLAGDEPDRLPVRRVSLAQEVGPSLEGGTAWINSAPIRLEDLRGKVVILDFWTYCCINCHHILPTLAKIEKKYENEVVVIGVHSPKFYAERDTENIRSKVREYHIKHPVINDADQVIWQRFGVSSWPTLVIIDPRGRLVRAIQGEPDPDLLDRFIGRLVELHRNRGELNETPVKFFPEIEKADTDPLLFPGKIVADAEENCLFIADTGHHRIVVTDLDGKHLCVIGTGNEGLVDGPYAKAEFNRPQGMCRVGRTLYVADTENHALRAIDLKTRKVSTVAGTGKQSPYRPNAHGPGKTTSLTSPWDVIQLPGTQTLLIAMAGQHQLWKYDVETDIVSVWAGTSGENIVDGPLREAQFAQPSGLATDGKYLFVADSETSSVRAIGLAKNNQFVRTIVGQGLFVFADVDGEGDEVRLQHCLGLAYSDGKLYIADTYNNKIKVCDPPTRSVKTLAGNVERGKTDDPPRFYQPGGLSVIKDTLYVADTNNGLIRTINLKRGTVDTLNLDGVSPPARPKRAPRFPNAQTVELPKQTVVPGETLNIEVTLPLPDGMKLNTEASMSYVIEAPDQPGAFEAGDEPIVQRVDPPALQFTTSVRLGRKGASRDTLKLKLSASSFVCSEKSNLCQVKSYIFTVPISFAADGEPAVKLRMPEK
jgi:thiol-disulfide isomerase/thioredoxin